MTDKEKLELLIEAIDYSFWNPIDKVYNKELTWPVIDKVKYIKGLMEEPVEEDFEEALANEWKGYIDRGAATVDALEDNTQELAFAKGFYRGAKWKEQKDSIVSEDLEEVAKYYIPNENYHMIIESDEGGSGENVYDYKQLIDMFKAGSKWQKGQMMAKAIDVVIGNEWGHPRCVLTQYDLEPLGIRSKDRVKVIVIKEG